MWESKTGKVSKPIKDVIKLVTTVDDWRSIKLGSMGNSAEPHLRVILPKG